MRKEDFGSLYRYRTSAKEGKKEEKKIDEEISVEGLMQKLEKSKLLIKQRDRRD